MLKSLYLKNFTVFADARFDFGKNLNIFVGENGTGKTHVLKVVYCVLRVGAPRESEIPYSRITPGAPTKTYFQKALADKLRGVFRPDEIGRLVRRQQGRNRAEVECYFHNGKLDLSFSLNSTSKSEVTLERTPIGWISEFPIYLPTRELLTIAPGFVALFENTYFPFEETWRDTTLLLEAPLAKGPRESLIKTLLAPLEAAMDGKVEVDAGGRFLLKTANGNIEMHLVAEGLRKLAMVARLIATGNLLAQNSALFWDEPEANLNSKTIKAIARTILQLSQNGIQIFIATHSLFLLRELYILLETEFRDLDARCFGLHKAENGAVTVEQGQTIDDIGEIAALDEELSQSERYLETEEALSQAS